ncbi:MAG TPA: hypothetical protein VEY33_08160 [Gemmatimonadota bacterium]|nr:hypothetical protein [Gemmatimonadota bacterium]
MIRSVSLVVTVALILPHLTACVTHRQGRAPATEAAGPNRKITGVTTTAGDEVAFDRPRPPEEVAGEVRPAVAAARIVGDSLIATARGAPYRIALADTREIWFEESEGSALRTLALVAGIGIGGFFLLAALASRSAGEY